MTEYRKSQASLGFPFGADSTYMMQLYLKENTVTNKPQASQVSKPSQHPQTKYDPTSGKPICGRFNTASVCALRGCKFAHICRTCFKSHSDSSHHTQSATPSPNPPTAKKTSALAQTSPCPTLPPLLKNLATWEAILHNDPDRDLILDGICTGFSLVDPHINVADLPLPQPQTVSPKLVILLLLVSRAGEEWCYTLKRKLSIVHLQRCTRIIKDPSWKTKPYRLSTCQCVKKKIKITALFCYYSKIGLLYIFFLKL